MNWHDAFDWIIPHVEPLSKEKQEEVERRRKEAIVAAETRINAISGKGEDLDNYYEEAKALVEDEGKRKQSVETRLSSIIGLTSVALTLVLTGLVSVATGGTTAPSPGMRVVFALAMFYLALQLCVALIYAIRGLERRDYIAHSADTIFPPVGSRTFKRDRVLTEVKTFASDRETNNFKVTMMAVAHTAVRNFLVALALFALALAIYVLVMPPPSKQPGTVCNINCEQRQVLTSLVHIAKIGPFSSGGHTLNAALVRSCIAKSRRELRADAIRGWYVIGNVDKRELRRVESKTYGSNQGLAMARANWVRETILSPIGALTQAETITIVGGPQHTELKSSADDFADDRSVDIFALVNREAAHDHLVPPPQLVTRCP